MPSYWLSYDLHVYIVYVPIAMCYVLEPKQDVQKSQTFSIPSKLEIKQFHHSL